MIKYSQQWLDNKGRIFKVRRMCLVAGWSPEWAESIVETLDIMKDLPGEGISQEVDMSKFIFKEPPRL